jgi:glutamate synthase (NADPH/NADH) small chain
MKALRRLKKMTENSKRKTSVKMRNQDPFERIKNFDEVPYGYNTEEALAEAGRCLQCKNPPCIGGCPVNINIKGFIKDIGGKRFKESIGIIKESSSLPAVCGRVCPQERQCEEVCVMRKTGNPINIGALERFAADWEAENIAFEEKHYPEVIGADGKQVRIAVIGAGPAGLTAAGELAKMGYKAVIFEALHIPGGVLVYGIPEFRLPKRIVEREVNYLKKLGVEILPNVIVGKSYMLMELFDMGYSAVFVGVGAGAPNCLDMAGSTFKGVYAANEFLTRLNLLKAYKFPEYATPVSIGKNIAVIGGGNVAMDAVRSCKRLPGVEKAMIIYRRTENEMPARLEEVERAKEEGIIFHTLSSPVEIVGNDKGWVSAVKCIKMQLKEADAGGRRGVKEIAGSEFTIEADTVIMALGTTANRLLTTEVEGLALNKYGYISVSEDTLATSIPGVFAGGDITTGSDTVIKAMGAGKKAARSIDEYIKSRCRRKAD